MMGNIQPSERADHTPWQTRGDCEGAEIEHIVPEGEMTLSDRDLGVESPSSADYRASGRNFEGAPHGAVIVDAAAKKRRREYKAVSLNEMLEHEQEEYYESEEFSSENSSEEEEPTTIQRHTSRSHSPKRRCTSATGYDIEGDDLIVMTADASPDAGYETPSDSDIFVESEEESSDSGKNAFTVSITSERSEIPRQRQEYSMSDSVHDNTDGDNATRERRSQDLEEFSEYDKEEYSDPPTSPRCRPRDSERLREEEYDDVDICPLCVYGNTDYDKIACEKAAVMWDVLGVAFFSLADSRGAAVVVSTYWNTEISAPSHKRAKKAQSRGKVVKPIPYLEANQAETHITEHMGDPRVYLGVSIERNRKLERLLTDFCFERTDEGDVRPNLSVLNQLRLLNKHTMDLYKQDPREMFGYCDSWTANPKDINIFINLSRCKVTTQQNT